ncbi:MAG: hypothetical protein WB610_07570, partial [Rhodomicrobium sp.]
PSHRAGSAAVSDRKYGAHPLLMEAKARFAALSGCARVLRAIAYPGAPLQGAGRSDGDVDALTLTVTSAPSFRSLSRMS